MAIQYKPTKPKKEKPVKEPKAPKAEKPVSFGSANAVKFDKPKKVKEKKIKAPKPEKAEVMSFTPTKAEKATKFEGAGKLKKPVNTKILASVLVSVAVIAIAILLVFTLKDNEPIVEPMSLFVVALPDTTYYVGEQPSFVGLKLKMTFTNDKEITVDGSECEITGFDSSKPAEDQLITVKYKDLETTFTVTISEMPEPNPDANYNGLSFKKLPDKTAYKVGEWPDLTGGILLVHYDDGTTRELPLDSEDVKITEFTTASPGTYEVIVKYVDESNRYGETSFTITVTE